METEMTPTPGSPEAVQSGCTCPRLDNAHGKGYMGGVHGPDGQPMFVISGDCPVHVEKET
jgi:hypothetical protein